jgi:hypothetical protein
LRVGYNQHAAPRGWKRETREQWTARIAFTVAASFDHETAMRERPRPDGRPAGATDGSRQVGRIDRHSVELGKRAAHREGKLRPRPETRMRRQRAVHVYQGSTSAVEMLEKTPSIRQRARGILPLRFQRLCRTHRDDHGRIWSGGTNAAKPSTEISTQIEDSEVQPRGGLDENGLLIGHDDLERM